MAVADALKDADSWELCATVARGAHVDLTVEPAPTAHV
jgi:hypothetical protein